MIRIDNLCVELPGFSLTSINLKIGDGEYFILVGPYASGKTVLLETIAGLRRPTAGEIWVDDRNVTSLEPEKRNIGMVYQDCSLFPHLTVAENIAFGLRVRHRPAREVARELERVRSLFGIGDLMPRRPDSLSGGERQKVALARALVTNPRALLLDEPLGALDPRTREGVRQELARLPSNLGISIIHVTHDFEEAVTMGSRIAVIGGGSIRQAGTADEIFRHPNSEFVARFTMAVNVFCGSVRQDADGPTVFSAQGIELAVESDIRGVCFAAVRPENIVVSGSPAVNAGCVNAFSGTITSIVNKGSTVDVTVDVPPAFTCLLTRYTLEQLGLAVGQQIYMAIPPALVSVFLDEGQP